MDLKAKWDEFTKNKNALKAVEIAHDIGREKDRNFPTTITKRDLQEALVTREDSVLMVSMEKNARIFTPRLVQSSLKWAGQNMVALIETAPIFTF